MEEWIRSGLTQLGLTSYPVNAPAQLAQYGRMLLEQNKVMNLTAITEPEQVVALHFLDSAALFGALDLKDKHVIDVGTGAGFPGLPLQLLEPSLHLTLLDSLGKRMDWLRTVCTALAVDNVTCLHARAEEQALLPGFRDHFDLAVSRAVADLRILCELCLPYVRQGGFFLAMKSLRSDEELSAAMSSIRLLGGRVHSPYDYALPGLSLSHRVVRIEKIAPTPKGYPRRWAKILKNPL